MPARPHISFHSPRISATCLAAASHVWRGGRRLRPGSGLDRQPPGLRVDPTHHAARPVHQVGGRNRGYPAHCGPLVRRAAGVLPKQAVAAEGKGGGRITIRGGIRDTTVGRIASQEAAFHDGYAEVVDPAAGHSGRISCDGAVGCMERSADAIVDPTAGDCAVRTQGAVDQRNQTIVVDPTAAGDGRIVGDALIESPRVTNDPNFAQVLAVQASGGTDIEAWADIMANYAAGNINKRSPAGLAMYNFVTSFDLIGPSVRPSTSVGGLYR